MSDLQRVQTEHAPASRRRFLKVAGAGVAGASLLTMLDARQAPAQLKGTTLRILTWSHFIPAYDVWFDKWSAGWGDQNGVKVKVDHIPHLEIPARMAAEFAAGAGHDIILNNATILARLYYKSLLDLTDVYDGLGKKHGGWIPAAKSPIEVEGRIYGIPMYYILLPMLWRKDLFEANGLKPPDTWELARVAARTLKPKGNPTGMAFSHCNDANLNWRSLMFSFGATETDPSGERPTIDSTIAVARANMKADRTALITTGMSFNDKDGAAFWPIYQQYEYERSKVDDGRAAVIKQYAQKYPNLTDADAKAMAEQMLECDSRLAELKKKYYKKFNKVLPALTVAKFFQLDRRVDLLMDMNVESSLPPLTQAKYAGQRSGVAEPPQQ